MDRENNKNGECLQELDKHRTKSAERNLKEFSLFPFGLDLIERYRMYGRNLMNFLTVIFGHARAKSTCAAC